MMRRGQMEMIGLVFIVIVLVIGIVLFLTFMPKARASQGSFREGESLLIAFGQATVPACGVSVSEVARQCANGGTCRDGSDACVHLSEALGHIAPTLDQWSYNISLEGTAVMHENGCQSANPRQPLQGTPTLPIPLGGGRVAKLKLAVCG
jgi:hypothetical protein